MSTLKVDSIIGSSGGNTAVFNGIPLRPGAIDPNNRIINGAFDFWQRGTSSSAGGYVTADRWINSFSTGTVTQSRQAFAIGDILGNNSPTYYLRTTVSGQTAGGYAVINQRIEGVRSYSGQTITILGWVRRSSGTGNMGVYTHQYFGTGGTPSSEIYNSSTSVTLTDSWAPFAVNTYVPSISGKTLGTNANDYLDIAFVLSSAALIQTIGVDLWGIHIKIGTHNTEAVNLYSIPDQTQEFSLCQRYYQTGASFAQGGYSATWALGHSVLLPTKMRTTPSVSFTIGASSNYSSGLSTQSLTPDSLGWNATMTAGSGGFLYILHTADAEI